MSPLVVDAGNHPVTAQIDWQPEGVVVKTGSVLGLMTVKVKSGPARFREFIESPMQQDRRLARRRRGRILTAGVISRGHRRPRDVWFRPPLKGNTDQVRRAAALIGGKFSG